MHRRPTLMALTALVLAGQRPAATEIGRAGARRVHTHCAEWRRGGQPLRLTLLSFDDQQAVFDAALTIP